MPEFAILLGVGALEGALLGRGQAMAMSRLQLPTAILRLWPVATSVAAVVAWSIGLIPGSMHRMGWSSWSVVALGCGTGPRAAGFHPHSPVHAASNRAPDRGALGQIQCGRMDAGARLDVRTAGAGHTQHSGRLRDRRLRHRRHTDGDDCRDRHRPVLAELVEARQRTDRNPGRS